MLIKYGVIINEEPSVDDKTPKSYEVYYYCCMSNINKRKKHEAIFVNGHFVLCTRTAYFNESEKKDFEIFDVTHESKAAERKLYDRAKRTAREMRTEESAHGLAPQIIDRTSRAKESRLSKLVKINL